MREGLKGVGRGNVRFRFGVVGQIFREGFYRCHGDSLGIIQEGRHASRAG